MYSEKGQEILRVDEGDMEGNDAQMAILLTRLKEMLNGSSISRKLELPDKREVLFDIKFVEETKIKLKITFTSTNHGGRIVFETDKSNYQEKTHNSFYIGGVRTVIKDLFTN